MKTTAIIEKGSDGSYSIFTPDLQSTISGFGNTFEDARNDFLQAYSEALSVYNEAGMPVPEELRNLEFAYRIDVIIRRESNGLYLAIPEGDFGIGLHAEGQTVEEAVAGLEKVCRQARGFKSDLPDLEFEYRYDIPSFFDAHQWLNIGATAERMGINPSLMRSYKRGQFMSGKRVREIEEGLHRLGGYLQTVRLVR